MSDLFAEFNEDDNSAYGSYDSNSNLGSLNSKNDFAGGSSSYDEYDEDAREFGYDDRKKKINLAPIFSIQDHPLKLSRRKNPFSLKTMAVSNGIMAMGSKEGSILRCTVDVTGSSRDNIEEIMIDPQVSVSKVFLDPSGGHMIITMANKSNFYLHTGSKRPKKIVKAQDLRFTCVAWDRQQGSPSYSGSVLIGTSGGAVFEAIFDSQDTKHFKKVFEISNQGAINGLEFEYWPSNVSSSTNSGKMSYKFFVMLSTSGSSGGNTRLFQFFNGNVSGLEELFQTYSSSNKDNLFFQELPHTNKQFGDGVFHGDLIFGSSSTLDNIISGSNLLPYFTPNTSSGSEKHSAPISLASTQYHVLILFPRKLQILNKLNGLMVLEHVFSSSSLPLGLVMDPTCNSFFVYTDRGRLHEVLINEEDRNVWKLFLQRAIANSSSINDGTSNAEQPIDDRDFELALSKCRTGTERQTVRTAQADFYFNRSQYDRAAVIYASSNRSFEEVALKFMSVSSSEFGDGTSPLQVFLLQKLRYLSNEEKTQKTVICTWLVELYLDKFNSSFSSSSNNNPKEIEYHANLLFEFKQFLQDHKNHLNPATTFNLIASHGRSDELVFYASLIEDFEKVVVYHIQKADYGQAIEILRSAPPIKVEELYYKFSPELILHKPKELFDAWKDFDVAAQGSGKDTSSNHKLNPTRLIPALVRGQQKRTNQVLDLSIDFLNRVIKQDDNQDPTIHNYMLFLLVKHPDERRLIHFLKKKHGPEQRYFFDTAFALRLCTQREKNRACVYIFAALGLHQEAVEKALQVDVKIAKEMANMPKEKEVRKKLWLLIAKHTIDAGGDIKEAMGILKESRRLKIEDILPYFPENVVINTFKKEICESLTVYNNAIADLKGEMKDYTASAEVIRSDMQQLRKRANFVPGNQRCDLTGQAILGKEFYLFPCGHAFIASALRQEMLKFHLNSFQRQTVRKLIDKSNQLTRSVGLEIPAFQKTISVTASNMMMLTPDEISSRVIHNTGHSSEREMLQKKLDETIAKECLFCGEIMIKSIDKPFITEEDREQEELEWKV